MAERRRDMSRLFIIGDVHGMAGELGSLFIKLDPQPGDRFAFLGDYVDKGPNSILAMRLVRDVVDKFPGSVAICGNHEDSAMRLFAKSRKQGNWDGLRKVDKEPWLKAMTQDDYDWLRTLPLVARPLPGTILVHGGMFPAYFEKHDEIGEVQADWHKGGGKRLDRMRRFLRVRHVYKPGSFSKKGKPVDGQMVSLGDEGESTLNWAEWYDGREGFAFYGHAPQRNCKPLFNEHALGLDTGAVFGGRLTAAVIYEGRAADDVPSGGGYVGRMTGRHVRLVSVEAGAKHAEWLEDFEA
jgi:hypothetical protein